ncbi:MAG: cold-shock protein [Candidatus Hydrogenedentota bacterium]
MATVEQLLEGTVKWFNNKKGYGFIVRDDSSDVFVHHTAIKMDGFRTLRQGDFVTYELHETDKGPQAQNVTPHQL